MISDDLEQVAISSGFIDLTGCHPSATHIRRYGKYKLVEE